jgi:hypothetical protein
MGKMSAWDSAIAIVAIRSQGRELRVLKVGVGCRIWRLFGEWMCWEAAIWAEGLL